MPATCRLRHIPPSIVPMLMIWSHLDHPTQNTAVPSYGDQRFLVQDGELVLLEWPKETTL
jgi:hypothetical protein